MTEVRTTKGTRKPRHDPSQLGLFDAASRVEPPAVALPSAQATPMRRAARRAAKEPVVITLTSEDMPDYSPDLVTQIDQEIATIPTDRVLLTYKEIWDYFGVSRATVVRRMKDRLIPGIRMSDGRVLDDGPVRRLSRVQVRWLLLAVRRRRSC